MKFIFYEIYQKYDKSDIMKIAKFVSLQNAAGIMNLTINKKKIKQEDNLLDGSMIKGLITTESKKVQGYCAR